MEFLKTLNHLSRELILKVTCLLNDSIERLPIVLEFALALVVKVETLRFYPFFMSAYLTCLRLYSFIMCLVKVKVLCCCFKALSPMYIRYCWLVELHLDCKRERQKNENLIHLMAGNVLFKWISQIMRLSSNFLTIALWHILWNLSTWAGRGLA